MPRDIHALLTPIRASLASSGLAVVDEDIGRPWGGFLAISPHDIQRFTGAYFAEAAIQLDERSVGLSPKILLVAPGRRLSWQYHCRRSEIWRIIQGTVAISRGPNDEEPPRATGRETSCGSRSASATGSPDSRTGVSSQRSGSTPTSHHPRTSRTSFASQTTTIEPRRTLHQARGSPRSRCHERTRVSRLPPGGRRS